MKFWNNEHPLNADYDRLSELLVPISGKSDYLVGECLRAASRIYYDHYNNGSCNNVTGAWNFLDSTLATLMDQCGLGPRLGEMNAALMTVGPYANCDAPEVDFKDVELNKALDFIVENVVMVAVVEENSGIFSKNTVDMFDFQEKEEYADDEEDSWL